MTFLPVLCCATYFFMVFNTFSLKITAGNHKIPFYGGKGIARNSAIPSDAYEGIS